LKEGKLKGKRETGRSSRCAGGAGKKGEPGAMDGKASGKNQKRTTES